MRRPEVSVLGGSESRCREPQLRDVLPAMAQALRGIRSGSAGWDDVAAVAARTVPGADGAAVAFSCADGAWATRGCPWSPAEESVRIQFDLDEGPCVDALSVGTVTVTDLTRDERWSVYAPKVAGMGIGTQLAVELSRDEDRRAVLCLSARVPGSFTAGTEQIAEVFASHASLAVGCLDAVEAMSNALSSRGTIGQAIGILTERYRMNETQAFDYLVRLSQTRNTKLRAIAEDVVAEGNRQAAEAS